MIGSLSKLRFKMEDLLARLVSRLVEQGNLAVFKVGIEAWLLKNRNLASAMFVLPLRASSQVRSSNAGTSFSKPGEGPFFASKLILI
jgi:hypothetical protein